MLETSSKRAQIIEAIDNRFEFFARPAILSSEKTQLFDISGNKKKMSKESNAEIRKPPVKYTGKAFGIAGQFKVRTKYHPQTHSTYILPAERNFSFFVPLELPSGHAGFLIKTTFDFFLFDCVENSFNSIESTGEITTGSSTVKIGNQTYKISSKTSPNKRELGTLFTQLITEFSIGRPFEPYHLFFMSSHYALEFPPVNKDTILFYRSLFSDFIFMFIFQLAAYDRVQMPILIESFCRICGAEFPRLYQFMAWFDFRTLSGPNMVMRGNNFFVSTTTYIVNKDPAFKNFVDSLSLTSEHLMEDFLTEFEKMDLGTLPHFVLHTIYGEGKRFFPDQNAQRFAVSGVLFLRLFSSQIITRDPEHANNIKPIVPIYNMNDDKHPDAVRKVEEIIDKYKVFPPEYEVIAGDDISIEDVEIMMKFIVSKSQDFINQFRGINYIETINQFNKREKLF